MYARKNVYSKTYDLKFTFEIRLLAKISNDLPDTLRAYILIN